MTESRSDLRPGAPIEYRVGGWWLPGVVASDPVWRPAIQAWVVDLDGIVFPGLGNATRKVRDARVENVRLA